MMSRTDLTSTLSYIYCKLANVSAKLNLDVKETDLRFNLSLSLRYGEPLGLRWQNICS